MKHIYIADNNSYHLNHVYGETFETLKSDSNNPSRGWLDYTWIIPEDGTFLYNDESYNVLKNDIVFSCYDNGSKRKIIIMRNSELFDHIVNFIIRENESINNEHSSKKLDTSCPITELY